MTNSCWEWRMINSLTSLYANRAIIVTKFTYFPTHYANHKNSLFMNTKTSYIVILFLWCSVTFKDPVSDFWEILLLFEMNALTNIALPFLLCPQSTERLLTFSLPPSWSIYILLICYKCRGCVYFLCFLLYLHNQDYVQTIFFNLHKVNIYKIVWVIVWVLILIFNSVCQKWLTPPSNCQQSTSMQTYI